MIELAGQLWQQCGCMCAVVIVTRELHATLYATHGNYLTAHAHVARLAEYKEHVRTRHHHVIDFPQLMAAFTRARGAAAAYAMTLARTLDGLVRTPILRRAEERAAALVGEDGVAAGDTLKRHWRRYSRRTRPPTLRRRWRWLGHWRSQERSCSTAAMTSLPSRAARRRR